MALLPIRGQDDPVLRRLARRVGRLTPALQQLIDDMVETMRAAPGVGLAAPQVGVPLRLIVVEVGGELYTLCNPEVIRASGEQEEPEEGCLSVPHWYGPVRRYAEVTVKGRDRTGKEVRVKATGFLARVFQHEIDHLDGVLFLDRLTDRSKLRYLPPERQVRLALNGPPQGTRPAVPLPPAEGRPPVGEPG